MTEHKHLRNEKISLGPFEGEIRSAEQGTNLPVKTLPPPYRPGERLCPRCVQERHAVRKVYMAFQHGRAWTCQFLEDDLKTSLPKTLRFEDEAKIRELVRRGGGQTDMLDYGIETGRGGVWLELTEEQYQRLKR